MHLQDDVQHACDREQGEIWVVALYEDARMRECRPEAQDVWQPRWLSVFAVKQPLGEPSSVSSVASALYQPTQYW